MSSLNLDRTLTYSALEINGGRTPYNNKWEQSVDLKIKGTFKVLESLQVRGNVYATNDIVIKGNLDASNIFADAISMTTDDTNVVGTLCGNLTISKQTVFKNPVVLGNYITNAFERYGRVDQCLYNTFQDSSVCANDNDTITIDLASTSRMLIGVSGTTQIGAIGTQTTTGNSSFTSGYQTRATGSFATATGNVCVASGFASHAENTRTRAEADYSHTEGRDTVAESTALASFVQGESNTVTGEASHTEGQDNTVSGLASHVEGLTNTVSSDYSYVCGSFNFSDSSIGIDHMSGTQNISTGTGGVNHIHGISNTVTDSIGCHVHGESHMVLGGANYSHLAGKEGKATHHSQWVHAAGKFTNVGDSQTSIIHLRTKTDSLSQSSNLTLTYPDVPELYPKLTSNSEIWFCDLTIIGRDQTSTDYFAQKRDILVSSEIPPLSNIHTTFELGTLVGSNVSVNMVNKESLVITINSVSSNTTHWAATLRVVQET